MYYDEFAPWDWVKFPENQNANYNYTTVEKFKNNPKMWLASIPMFEYAHVLTVTTALRCGGDPDKYVDDLYKKRMNPILKRYYDKLATYRYHRALLMRPCGDLKDKVNNTTLTDESAKMKAYARKTRQALRAVAKDFEDELAGRKPYRQGAKHKTQDDFI